MSISKPGTFTTPKGTVLYLMDIQGKPYLPVQERIIWFREDYPKGRIMTEIVSTDAQGSICKAIIESASGEVLATAHKAETKAGFSDHLEKCETGAIGRALALCGFGTQFTALEFHEGQRLADAPLNHHKHLPGDTVLDAVMKPVAKPPKPSKPVAFPGDHVIRIGKKYMGQKISDVDPNELASFVQWMKSPKCSDGFRNSEDAQEFMFYYENFINEPPLPSAQELDREMSLAMQMDEPLPF